MPNASPGTIYLAATPIGNTADASPRLREALENADLIAAEDTRRLRALCSRLGIVPNGRVIAFHEHVEGEKSRELIAAAQDGQMVVVVSDAGTPTVSDPGFRLGQEAAKAGVRLSPLPGPSAALAALSVSGLPSDRFTFEGFLPRKSSDQRQRLAELSSDPRTTILFESPRRTADTLGELAEAFGGERPAIVGRELTKTHEEVVRGTLAELHKWASQNEVLGEITIVIAGQTKKPDVSVEELGAQAVALSRRDGLRLKEACALVAEGTGVRANAVFRAALNQAGS